MSFGIRQEIGFIVLFVLKVLKKKSLHFILIETVSDIGALRSAITLKIGIGLTSAEKTALHITLLNDENKVYFAHHMLYHPERFFSFAESIGFEVFELFKSRNGHSVPCPKLGNDTFREAYIPDGLDLHRTRTE